MTFQHSGRRFILTAALTATPPDSGASGNIGTSTLAALTAQGHRVRALVTDTARGNVAQAFRAHSPSLPTASSAPTDRPSSVPTTSPASPDAWRFLRC